MEESLTYKEHREKTLKNQLITGIAKMQISELNKQLMLEYISELSANGIKASTLGNRISCVRELAKFIEKETKGVPD